jgi:hypothetical protein
MTQPPVQPPLADDRAHDRAFAARRPAGSGRNWWILIVGMSVAALLGTLMFFVGRWTATLADDPEPPPTETVPNAPGPDNDIKSMPPKEQVEPSRSNDE